MTEDELDAIETRATNASDGEWGVLRDDIGIVEGDEETGKWVSKVFATLPTGHVVNREANAAFILRSRADVIALVAEVRGLTAERDAVFNRGVEATREAAAKVAAQCASERGHTQATMFAASRPDDAFVVGIKGGEASRIEGLIRALKVAP